MTYQPILIPTPVATVPTLTNARFLLTDGTYLSGAQLQTLLGGSAPAAISVATPSGWTAGSSGTIGGTYTGTVPTGVNYAYDGGAAYAAAGAFTASGGNWSGTATYPAAGSHTITVQEANATGIMATSPTFSVVAAAVASAYTTALSATSGAVGTATTMTFTPTGGAWPSSLVITPSVSTVTGTFSPATISPTGSAAATCTFTPSAAGSGTLGSGTSPSLTNTTGALAFTATAAANAVTNGYNLTPYNPTAFVTTAYALPTAAGSYQYGQPGGVAYVTIKANDGTVVPDTLTTVIGGWGTSSTVPPPQAAHQSYMTSGAIGNGWTGWQKQGTSPLYKILSSSPAAPIYLATGSTPAPGVNYYLWFSIDSGANWSVARNASNVPIAFPVTA